ncbi:MAG: sialate O-acetylesterase [Bacilli bacterium]
MLKIKKNLMIFLFIGLISSCGGGSSAIDSIVIDDIDYTVSYYFETLQGEYVINDEYTLNKTGKEGSPINIDIREFEGFTFDEYHPSNKTEGTLSSGTSIFALYYLRNSYDVVVLGGEASKAIAKFEETITITPYLGGTSITLNDNSKATLNGHELTLGAEDVTVMCLTQNKYSLSDTLLTKERDYSASVNLTVKEKDNIQGLVFSFISKNLSDDGHEQFYLFGTRNDEVGFYRYSGGSLNLIKSKVMTEFELGSHKYAINFMETGSIRCFIDDISIFNVTQDEIVNQGFAPIDSYGRVGVYSQKQYFEYQNLIAENQVVSLEEAKQYYIDKYNKFIFSQHVFDTATYTMNDGDVQIDIKDVKGYALNAIELEENINAANNLQEIDTALDGYNEIRIAAAKAYTQTHLLELLYDVHYATIMLYATKHQTKYYDSATTLDLSYLVRDERQYVPSAYKLRGSEGETCLLDQLDVDLNKAKTEREIYVISNKYALDLVRALSFRNYEFYYWNQYHQYPGSNYQVWDMHFYNYFGAAGSGFKYVGKVFEGFTWSKDFRLNRFLFNPDEPNYAKTIQEVIGMTDWMIKHQTIRSRPYIVTLNADGGTLTNYELNGTSANALVLPTPSKEGHVFDGWYLNRLLKGTKLTSVPQGNLEDKTLYAAWKKDGVRVESVIQPAAYITENMIIQQNQDIVFSGKGKDGVNVTVSFDGENKTTVISDSKWQVTFTPRQAAFDPKIISISGGGVTYAFKNVLVGEVWLCAGQSNMEMLACWLNGRGVKYAGQYGDFDNLDKIRVFRQYIDDLDPFAQLNADNDRWCIPTRAMDLADKSILSVAFACNLQKELNIPVGVLTSARGGTYIEEWLSEENVNLTGNTIPAPHQDIASRYYEQMTVDLINARLAGVIWYQGENNWPYPEIYKGQYKALVSQYRDVFNNPNLPVIAQQIVDYGENDADFSDIRIAQWEVAGEIANAYCSVAIDTGEKYDIHPIDKLTLGRRMGKIALEFAYGVGSDSLSYAPIKAEVIEGKIRISFKEGQIIQSGEELQFFKLKKVDGTFVSVTATLENNQIVIEDIDDAEMVYYAHQHWLGHVTLYGGNDLPITPFKINITR